MLLILLLIFSLSSQTFPFSLSYLSLLLFSNLDEYCGIARNQIYDTTEISPTIDYLRVNIEISPTTKSHQEWPQDQPSLWQRITPRSTPPSTTFKSTRARIKNTSLLPLRRVKRSLKSSIWVLGSNMVTGYRGGTKFCFMFSFCFLF